MRKNNTSEVPSSVLRPPWPPSGLTADHLRVLECCAASGDPLSGLATSRPLDQSGPSECPLIDVALMASVSATDSVPQNDHAVAEPLLVNQFQLQPHTIREERVFRRRRPQGRRTFEARPLIHPPSDRQGRDYGRMLIAVL